MKYFLLSTGLFLCFNFSFAQKRALEHKDFDTWKRIVGEQLSPDGKFVVYQLSPGKDDPTLKIKAHDGKQSSSFDRATNAAITWDSKFAVFALKPSLDSINALRRKKVKEDKLPKDSLVLFNLSDKKINKIPRVKSYKVPEKWNGYIFYKLEDKLIHKDTTKSDTVKVKSKSKKKKVSKDNGYHLVVRNLSDETQDTIKYVTDYELAEEAGRMIYHTSGMDSTILEGVYYYNVNDKTSTPLCRSKGKYSKLSLSKNGMQAAFVSDLDTTKALYRNFELRYYTTLADSAIVIADSTNSTIPKGWGVSQYQSLKFSDDGNKLFFGTTPKPITQDTTLLPEEIVNVEVWSYKDQRLQTQQNAEIEEDKKKAYLTVFNTQNKKIIHPASLDTESIRITEKGNSNNAIGLVYTPYNSFVSWEGFPRRQDLYVLNFENGSKKLVKKDLRGWADLSAKGNYLFWYNADDSTYNSYHIESDKTFVLTNNIKTSLTNELNDQPNYPSPYGVAGWTIDDEKLLIYDRYDIIAVDPKNQLAPEFLTSGRKDSTTYRFVDLDRDEDEINLEGAIFHAFNEKSRNEGYFTYRSNKNLKELIYDSYRFTDLIKAKNSTQILFTKQDYQLFPDLLTSDLSFKKIAKLSNANPGIKSYLWGTVELYKWTSLDGDKLEGLLYKPENFDPKKQYPMIAYFYERNSHHLNRHWGAVPIRSIINPTFYASRGYVVFVPDIPYKIGYPGESAYSAVIPGVTSLIAKGYIDKDHIGMQGHSWGGYQTAYLATRTDIFAAAESGAPVSNMISAYGGIRWQTGLSRMFQYEHTQSRIGVTLCEYPLRYIENSPIFYVDKINTPMLLMHNDNDGHVPWYQGIEMFVAMRRLGKPAWMLNYNGEPHWPTKWENIRDFNIRLQQFFDYYLKDELMPTWMEEGIPAIEKGINKGYETSTK